MTSWSQAIATGFPTKNARVDHKLSLFGVEMSLIVKHGEKGFPDVLLCYNTI